jgi:hypothetical protein
MYFALLLCVCALFDQLCAQELAAALALSTMHDVDKPTRDVVGDSNAPAPSAAVADTTMHVTSGTPAARADTSMPSALALGAPGTETEMVEMSSKSVITAADYEDAPARLKWIDEVR